MSFDVIWFIVCITKHLTMHRDLNFAFSNFKQFLDLKEMLYKLMIIFDGLCLKKKCVSKKNWDNMMLSKKVMAKVFFDWPWYIPCCWGSLSLLNLFFFVFGSWKLFITINFPKFLKQFHSNENFAELFGSNNFCDNMTLSKKSYGKSEVFFDWP